ncbi:uncharacterized protein HMPREF1541_01215 [Cyphellophora europaea CBS 101466]|uniref:Short-chain dehydrogenase n=1 Tax=Cyphellophora europaea (strain CBS 101466) TaxID=1220924 RepID=W2SEH5_CYPE1|nr:uncharacterized protein HMPREF1541_01215 [Cyphellophora europaea CBS 101466]ETN47025.1 hypothetical protein HMPREF1541_01215 [Cyphellophora europaea CBS 101466]
MTATTHASFGENTEGLEVAKAFGENIRGKTILVTGVNRAGVGFTTAQAFASQAPARVIISGRTPSKLQESIDALKQDYPDVEYRTLQMDLASQKGVRAAAAELLSWSDVPAVDIVVNNAGIMNLPERTINEDGLEMTWATNHLGHFLFTCLIMPKILKAAGQNPKGATRIINVTSGSPIMAVPRFSDVNFETVNKDLPEEEQPMYQLLEAWGYTDTQNKAYVGIEAYNQSKVANVLFSVGLNHRLFERHGILSLAVHPGVLKTELSRAAVPEVTAAIKKMFEQKVFTWRSQGAGASTSLTAATDPKLSLPVTDPGREDGKENVGVFLMDCQITDKARAPSTSSANAEKLWEISEGYVKEKFAW